MNGRVRSTWAQSSHALNTYERNLRSTAMKSGVDAVLQMSDYGQIADRPFFLYQDLSRRMILRRFTDESALPGEFNGISMKHLAEGAKRQQEIYQRAAAVFCMSEWLRADLVAGGVEPSRAVVVPPGINVDVERVGESRRSGPRSRLVIIGTEPIRKGLLEVLTALPLVRQSIRDAQLTVVGPSVWPVQGDVPDGVDFVGNLSRRGVADVLARSDLLVMPSRWEGFGMAFAEALVAGVPCIGRNDCAMPEIIEPPKYGRVVGGPDSPVPPDELADAIVTALRDDALFERVAADRDLLADRFSWRRSAEAMTSVIRSELQG
ncbi:MAG: glycosyltransferase family 4 protein [Gordonia polyisoprenivorans]|nr:glycosyltransferase family 4 protein [Gordonia polyisoprenivorans]